MYFTYMYIYSDIKWFVGMTNEYISAASVLFRYILSSGIAETVTAFKHYIVMDKM